MAEEKTSSAKSREERLAEQLRANLRRRKSAARKSAGKLALNKGHKKDATEP